MGSSNHEAGGTGETLEGTGGRATTGNICTGALCELIASLIKVNGNQVNSDPQRSHSDPGDSLGVASVGLLMLRKDQAVGQQSPPR